MANGEVFNAVNYYVMVWRDKLRSICQNFPKNLKEQAISTLQQFVNSLGVSTSSTSRS